MTDALGHIHRVGDISRDWAILHLLLMVWTISDVRFAQRDIGADNLNRLRVLCAAA